MKHRFFRKRSKVITSRLVLVIIIVIAAFLAAFVGQIAITTLSNTPSLLPDDSLIIRQSTDRFTQLENAREAILNNELSGLLEFYTAQDGLLSFVTSGLVLTNDGWTVGIEEQSDSAAELWDYVRLASGEIVEVEKIAKDPSSRLVFAKLPSNNLSPVTLSSDMDSTPLLSYIVAQPRGKLFFSQVMAEEVPKDLYLHSDRLNRYVKMTIGELGASIYNEKAEVVGIVAGVDEDKIVEVIKVSVIRDALRMLLREGEIKRASLNLFYIDVSRQALIAPEAIKDLDSGAFVTNKISIPPATVLARDSVGFLAGIRLNDVIVSVDGDMINHRTTLSDYILQHQPDDKIELGINRNGSSISIEVTLGARGGSTSGTGG